MPDAHKNFAYSLVATAPSPATSGTSLVVTAGQGALFPTPPFNATIWPTGVNPLSTNAEIVRVTAISTDTLTIVRAQESSSARTVIVGDQIAATITAKTLTDVESTSQLLIYNALGGATKAESMPVQLCTGGSALTSGTIRAFAVWLPTAQTLTGIRWFEIVAGSYTGDQYNGVGLYSYSGGTLTLVASSTNDANIWTQGANTVGSKAFSSTYAAAAGLYFIAFLYHQSAQTTAPTIGVFTNLAASTLSTMDFTNSAKLNWTLASQTSLPSSQAMSGVTAAANSVYGALY